MKIYIPESQGPKGGKDFFFDRLFQAFLDLGEIVVKNPSLHHDISLQSIFIKKTNTKKYVLRLDGIHHNIAVKFEQINDLIFVKGFEKADGIVYQSQFSKKMCDKYLGKFPGKSAVIFNGAKIKKVEKIIETPVVFSSARWRPHKRLIDILESFLLTNIAESILYIAGDLSLSGISSSELKKYQSFSNIIFLSQISQEILETYLANSDVFIHLCWIDYCPNGVIEAIALGVPVITNNVGGTCELVEPSGGKVLLLDNEYDLNPCDLYHPPQINQSLVARAIEDSCSSPTEIKTDHIDIKNIASQYINFFESLL